MATAIDLLAQRKQQLEADVEKLEKTVRASEEHSTPCFGRGAGKLLTSCGCADIQPGDGVPGGRLLGVRNCAQGAR